MTSINDRSLQARLERALDQSNRRNIDAMEKLSSGTVFTSNDPRPADQALAAGLEYKVRSLTSAKRNINDGISLLQTAGESMAEVNNMILRMKEINVSATNSTIDDRERRFLFLEYEALHDEISRVAETTNYNGIPLLNGASDLAPEKLVLRVGDPFQSDSATNDSGDLNAIEFDGLKAITVTPEALGIRSARDLLSSSSDEDGISLSDALELMQPDNDELFSTTYDEALNALSTQRAIYGSLQTRLQKALDFNDVFQENLMAARSQIADTDYAHEISNLMSSRILMQAGTAVLAHSNSTANMTLGLLQQIM